MIDIVPSNEKKEYELIRTNDYQVYNFLNTSPNSIEGLDNWGLDLYELISINFDFNSPIFNQIKLLSNNSLITINQYTIIYIVNKSFVDNSINAICKNKESNNININIGNGKLNLIFETQKEQQNEIIFNGNIDV